MILTLQTITPHIGTLKRDDKKIVLVTGFFDLLHPEHIAFLEKAAEKGDALVVGVESDKRARELKGEGRPIFSQEDRALMLDSIRFIDYVLKLPENFSKPSDHERLISIVCPDYLAVSENSPHQEEKTRILKKHGGRLAIVRAHNPDFSTTQILEKIKNT